MPPANHSVASPTCKARIPDVGRYVYAVGCIGLGIAGLIWADFATVWHPVPSDAPLRAALIYLSAGAFLLGGMALMWAKAVNLGAVNLAVLFTIFALFWVRRVVGFPHLIGTWSGLAEQLVLVIGALTTMTRHRSKAGARMRVRILLVAFGLCLVAFGLAHFLALTATAKLVPWWLPPSQSFWALLTGAAHLLAGAAIVTNIRATLAAQLLTAMFVVFELLVWAPAVIANLAGHMAWAGAALNLALVGAAWIMADALRALDDEQRSPWSL